MTLKDAQILRELTASVEALKRQVADLTRRLDDFSKADRARELKKS